MITDLDEQIEVFGVRTTIQYEMTKNEGHSLRIKDYTRDGVEQYQVFFLKGPNTDSDSRAKPVSKDIFECLKSRGIRNNS